MKSKLRWIAEIGDYMLYFGQGSFDEWCIYMFGPEGKVAPTDEWYFGILKKWCESHSPEDIYDHFVEIYDQTTQAVAQSVLDDIRALSDEYVDPIQAQLIFTILYMGMIAEENKAGAVLKKKIKRLGVYQVLIEGLTPALAANYSRGQSADYLQLVCHYRGF